VQPLLQRKSNKFYIFYKWVCSLRYTTHNAHAPHCNLWPARFFSIFPHYLINTIFENVTEKEMCFDFLYNFCLKYFTF